MGKYTNAVAAVLIGLMCLNGFTTARSIEPDLFEQRQLSLPGWLVGLRERFSSIQPASSTIRASNLPKAKKPAEVLNWPAIQLDFGQITGVAVDEESNPVIFHRGNVQWTGRTFDDKNQYTARSEGPIVNDTIVVLDAATGALKDHWGSKMFYMPHGLDVDASGNIWVTDVAMHQVFKFPKGSQTPSLTLGEAFVPGSDDKHFCKPTDVAVSSSGIIFVADGYCNNRIMKYSPDGQLIDTYTGSFRIPHSLVLIEQEDALCIADRENMRLVCIHAGLNGKDKFGASYGAATTNGKSVGRVFAVSAKGKHLFAVVNSIFLGHSEGKTINLDTLETESVWSPSKGFSSPHDVAVSRDGESMYVVEIGPNRIHKFALE